MGIESPTHLIFIAIVALVVLGPKRLPDLARSLGNGIREFRQSLDIGSQDPPPQAPPPPAASTPPAPPPPDAPTPPQPPSPMAAARPATHQASAPAPVADAHEPAEPSS